MVNKGPDYSELADQVGVKSDSPDGTQAFLASKGVSAGQNFAGNLFTFALVLVTMCALHGIAIYIRGTAKMQGMLAFPKLELVVATAFFQGLILSATAAIRLESCNAGFVSFGVLTVIYQILSGLVPIRKVHSNLVVTQKLDFEPTTPTDRKAARDELIIDLKELKKNPTSPMHVKKVEDDYNKLNNFGGYKETQDKNGAKFLNTHGDLFSGYTYANWWFCVVAWAEKTITAIFTSGVPGMAQPVLNWIVCFVVWAILCFRCPHNKISTNVHMIVNRTNQMLTMFFLMIGATTHVKPSDIAAVATCLNVIGTAHLLVQQLTETAGKMWMLYKMCGKPKMSPMLKKHSVEGSEPSPREKANIGLVGEDGAKKPGTEMVGVSNFLASREI